ncbi:MAG TPA: glycoside hydrolase family 2 TIM barrel-domain containing protein, partial [Thermoanaerobaculia bacterium]|nr:glycoside hydrolase family 2 TIM barrel-domain containing protein [Thermoanaerobaculia bacterium]
MTLLPGWQLRSSEGLAASGAEISGPRFVAAGWTPTIVPSTVLAGLMWDGEVPDPYAGRNLEAISTARFQQPWWYRTEFTLASPLPAEARLVFHGVNYSAEVWLNGVRLAGPDEVRGAFRTFELAVGRHLRAGVNALAVLVYPPQPGDFTIGFVDWNPRVPDASMGLWREVELRRTEGISLDDVFVRSDLEVPGRASAKHEDAVASARLTIGARLRNHTGKRRTTTLRGHIGDIDFAHSVALAPGEDRELVLTPAEVPQLLLRSPRLWWPNNLGEPNLYHLTLEAELGGAASDRAEVDFGIRQVADYVDADGRGYVVNGKKVLVRGAGWVDDLLLADDDERIEDQIRYVQHMNLNAIRLEGFWGSTPKLYDLADRYGVMVFVGWSCQWEWPNQLGAPTDKDFGGVDSEEDMQLVAASLRDQVVRLRNHPSVVVWTLASDLLPKPELEERSRDLLTQIDPTRPSLASCARRTSAVSGPSAVKMEGPYEWVPPNYWYLDDKYGGAYGFNTETGPGAQPPPLGSLRRMLPREHWWPIDEAWSWRYGRGKFNTLDYWLAALEGRYGKPTSLEDFARKAQLVNYEAMRAMFEAFSLRRPKAKGVVQWMLNSAWPDMFWQLYDWYLVPNGAYFGARTANRPVHIAYDYGERSVVAVNDTDEPLRGVVARVRVLDAASRVLLDESRPLEVPAHERGAVLAVGSLSRFAAAGSNALPPVYFLDARIEAAGRTVARNFYWLP